MISYSFLLEFIVVVIASSSTFIECWSVGDRCWICITNNTHPDSRFPISTLVALYGRLYARGRTTDQNFCLHWHASMVYGRLCVRPTRRKSGNFCYIFSASKYSWAITAMPMRSRTFWSGKSVTKVTHPYVETLRKLPDLQVSNIWVTYTSISCVVQSRKRHEPSMTKFFLDNALNHKICYIYFFCDRQAAIADVLWPTADVLSQQISHNTSATAVASNPGL